MDERGRGEISPKFDNLKGPIGALDAGAFTRVCALPPLDWIETRRCDGGGVVEPGGEEILSRFNCLKNRIGAVDTGAVAVNRTLPAVGSDQNWDM